MKKFAVCLALGVAMASATCSPLVLAPAYAQETEYPPISHDALKAAIKAKKVTLLDANGTDSWKSGHIPGALNFETASGKLARKLPANKNALIVAYCGNEYCTAYKAAAAEARKLGYTNVKHYSPGIKGWKESGAKVEKA